MNTVEVLLLVVILIELAVGWWIVRNIRRSYYRWQVSRVDFPRIDRMDGRQFEAFLETLFKSMGYRTTNVQDTNDYGADLVVFMNGRKTVVQAKRYKNSVGLSAVQEIVAAKAYYQGEDAMVVTNSYFTRSAKALAEVNKVTLWDRVTLAKILTEARTQENGSVLADLLKRYR